MTDHLHVDPAWLAPDDRLDELLWEGDVGASLEALERMRTLLLGPPPAAAAPETTGAALETKGAAPETTGAALETKGTAPETERTANALVSSRMKPPSVGSSPSSGEEQAPALRSSLWLNWENPGAAPPLSAGLPADTQELRRLKTRDAMRRSRQRQRDQLQTLRSAVQDLEGQYAQLCLVTERDLAVSTRSSDLADSVALSKRLGAENLMLQAAIQRQELWRQQLNVVMESRAINAGDGSFAPSLAPSSSSSPSSSTPASSSIGAESLPFRPEILDPLEAKSVFGFRPLSDEDVKDVILANSRAVRRVQRQLLGQRSGSGAGEEELAGVKPVATMDVFGWDVRQRVRGSHMEFVFSKRFTDVSVSEVMHKSWVSEMSLKGMRMIKYDTTRLEVLQEVSPNAYVLGREVLSPDSTPMFRSTLVRYRIESPPEPVDDADDDRELVASGFVIGTYSINPDAAETSDSLPSASSYARELAGDVLWADLSITIEFRSVADARTGEEQYVEIRWAGSTNYKSQFHAYRNTADKISQLLHWELLHIAPVAQIIPTSPR